MTAVLPAAHNALSWKPVPPLPDALGVAAHYAGSSGGALLVGGGANLPGEILDVACGSEEPGEQSATNRAFALDLAAEKPVWRKLGRGQGDDGDARRGCRPGTPAEHFPRPLISKKLRTELEMLGFFEWLK